MKLKFTYAHSTHTNNKIKKNATHSAKKRKKIYLKLPFKLFVYSLFGDTSVTIIVYKLMIVCYDFYVCV